MTIIYESPRASSAAPCGHTLDADAEDEALARAARRRYRTYGIASIEPGHGMRLALMGDEQLVAVRAEASIQDDPKASSSPLHGWLAITTKRMMIIAGHPVTVASLDELDDVTLTTDRLLVTLKTGSGFAVKACHPRLLRVQLAEARASRSDDQSGASSSETADLSSAPSRR